MPRFNVQASVIELVDAPDAAAAESILTQRLRAAGFEPNPVECPQCSDTFVSEIEH